MENQHEEEFAEQVSDDEFLNADDVQEEVLVDQSQFQDEGDDYDMDDTEGFEGQEEMEDLPQLDEPKIRISMGQSVYAVALHPKLPLLCCGGQDDRVTLFRYYLNGPSAEVIKEFTPHNDSVVSIKWSFDGSWCAAAGMDGRILVFNVTEQGTLTNEEHWLEGPDSEITFLAWHPRGLILSAGCNDGAVWTWYVPNQSVMRVMMQASKLCVPCVAGQFTSDGKHLAVIAEDPQLSLLDIKNDSFLWRADLLSPFRPSDQDGEKVPLSCIRVNQDGTVVAVGDDLGRIYVFNAQNGRCVVSLGSHDDKEIEQLEFGQLSNGQQLLFSCGLDGKILVWTMGTNLSVRSTLSHSDGVNGFFLSSDSRTVCSVTVDGKLWQWDVASGELVKSLLIHSDTPLCRDAQMQGSQVVFATGDDSGDVCMSVF